jgi:hypothetical protein
MDVDPGWASFLGQPWASGRNAVGVGGWVHAETRRRGEGSFGWQARQSRRVNGCRCRSVLPPALRGFRGSA